nr:reverse transcriptase domain-containing protein [Tanacetum cinerariifolium]
MSTRSIARNLFPPLDNPELTIQRRSRSDPTLLNNSKMAAEGNGDLPVPDLRTMEELCQPSLNGRGGSIAPIAIQATNFGLKNDRFNKSRILAYFTMAIMFLGKYFPPSMVTKLRNKITNIHQRLDESLFEAWERYKLYIDRCPNHNMFPVTQIDTFYNGLTLRHGDTINAATGGTFMKRRLEECYDLIENMTAHHNNWDTSAQRSESSSSITSSFDAEIAALNAEMTEINKNLMRVLQVNQQVKEVTPNCETCGGPHSFPDCPATVANTQNVYAAGAYQGNHHPQGNNQERNQFFQGAKQGQNQPPAYQAPAYQAPAYQALVYQTPIHQPQIPQPQVVTTNEFTNFMKANDAILKNMQTNMTSLTNSNLELKNMFGQFMKMNTALSLGSGTLSGNTITNPKEDLKGIITRRGTAYLGPTIPTTSSSPVLKHKTEATKDTMHPTNNGSTEDVQPLVVSTESPILTSEPVNSPIIEPVASPVSALKHNQRPLKIYISILAFSPKEVARKLGDPDKFLIPCDFPEMAECLALADLGASINLMPLFVWNKLSFPDLSPTCMTLELVDRSISHPVGVVEDVFVKVGTFHFPADFVVVDFDADPRVPLILEISFLKTERALINVFKGELTLRVGKEAINFNLDQTSRYSANYNDMTANRIDVIDMDCEEYSQEVLGFSDVIASGNPTPYYDPIVSTSFLTLTPFGNSDFLLEEVDAFLALEDDPTSPEFDQSYLNSEGDILLLEAFLNDDPSLLPPNQGNYLPELRKELKICEAKSKKSSIDEPPEVELKDLPPYLEYGFFGRPMTRLLEKDTPFLFSKECVEAFQTLKRKLTKALILIAPDWDMPFELMYDASDFAIGAVLRQRQEKHFRPIHYASKTITEEDSNYTITEKEMLAVVYAFEKFRSYLIMNKRIMYTDHSALKYLFAKKDSKATLLRWILLLQVFTFKVIDTKGAKNLAVDHLSRLENPHQNVLDPKEINESFPLEILNLVSTRDNSSTPWFADFANYHAENFIVKGISGNKYILVVVDYLSKWVEAKALPINDARVVCKLLKNLFAGFETPRAIISDRGTHFCNYQFAKAMQKFGVTHRLATPYHPQTNGQVEVSNCGLKRILERIVVENRASWLDKLDDALWTFRTAYKTPIRYTPYKLVYGKACHLPIELEHKAC